MTLDIIILLGLFGHERLNPALLRTCKGNETTLAELKEILQFL